MYKFMHEIDEIDKATRFQVIQTQARGHSFKYHRKISKNNIDTISSLIELQIYGILCQII